MKKLPRLLSSFLSRRRSPSSAPGLAPDSGFTAHNVRLDDGTETFPQAGWTMDENHVFRAVRRTLHLVFPDGLVGRSIVDVGCLEGGFATEFARLGMIATGIEVRESNFRNCLRVKAGTNLPSLRFIQDNANNIGQHGPFDAVFVCGLLYHLDQPRRFLIDAARNCRRVIFLETHVARAAETPARATYNLSAISSNEGLPGRWFPEHDNPPEDQLDQLKWASWSNARSFWLQKEYLLQLLKDLGFDIVFEQFDVDNDIAVQHTTGWRAQTDRVLLVGIKCSRSALFTSEMPTYRKQNAGPWPR
jgi:SAM-dependent methyltransferase